MSSRALNRLSAAKAASIKEPGKYPDGGGLYLVVTDSGRSWTFRYSRRGSRCEIGLGSARGRSLAKAREQASEYRVMIANGLDPKKEREQLDRRVTFGSFADAYIETMSASWRNPKHVAHWKMTLTVYAAPIRKTIIEEIDTDQILKVLKPLWTRVPETAGRLRGRIESVRRRWRGSVMATIRRDGAGTWISSCRSVGKGDGGTMRLSRSTGSSRSSGN